MIDNSTVINGSYNWTIAAFNKINKENIVVIWDDINSIESYNTMFASLITEGVPYSADFLIYHSNSVYPPYDIASLNINEEITADELKQIGWYVFKRLRVDNYNLFLLKWLIKNLK